MKDLFREFDFTKVGYYQSMIESAGIKTFVRNRDLSGLAGESSIMPDLWPTLCVVQDEDYDRAMKIIQDSVMDNAGRSEMEVTCPSCKETNPGNFDFCWSCGEAIAVPEEAG
jgi:hypothetical protein